MRLFTRSGLEVAYSAPQTASASADISAFTNAVDIARSRSEPGSASWAARNRAGSIPCGAVIAWTPFKSTVRGLKKDHAMTAYAVDATPTASPARARRTPLCGTQLVREALEVLHAIRVLQRWPLAQPLGADGPYLTAASLTLLAGQDEVVTTTIPIP